MRFHAVDTGPDLNPEDISPESEDTDVRCRAGARLQYGSAAESFDYTPLNCPDSPTHPAARTNVLQAH